MWIRIYILSKQYRSRRRQFIFSPKVFYLRIEESDICLFEQKAKEEREEKLTFIVQKQSILELKQSKILELQEQIKQAERKIETLTLSHKNFFQKREELYERISQLDKDGFRLQSQLDKLKEQLDTEIEYLWGEYELSPSAFSFFFCLLLK